MVVINMIIRYVMIKFFLHYRFSFSLSFFFFYFQKTLNIQEAPMMAMGPVASAKEVSFFLYFFFFMLYKKNYGLDYNIFRQLIH